MLNGFLQYLQYEKNYSSHTVLSYSTDINQFFHFLKTDPEHFSPSDVEPVMVQQWILEMMQRGMSARSISRKVSALKSFWNYLLKQNLAQVNPTLKIVLPKTKKPLPVFFKHREVSQVITDPHIPQDNFERVRDVLIVAVFYMTGIRLSELINIKENDVDLVAGELRVIGKRNKERIIPLDKLLCEKISAYIDKKEEFVGPGNSYLFVRTNGMKMYPKLVSNIIRKLMSQVSTLPQISPHVLRHSFATALLDGGADINAVKELLGHSSLAATQVYTHTGFETLHNIYKQAHPRAK